MMLCFNYKKKKKKKNFKDEWTFLFQQGGGVHRPHASASLLFHAARCPALWLGDASACVFSSSQQASVPCLIKGPSVPIPLMKSPVLALLKSPVCACVWLTASRLSTPVVGEAPRVHTFNKLSRILLWWMMYCLIQVCFFLPLFNVSQPCFHLSSARCLFGSRSGVKAESSPNFFNSSLLYASLEKKRFSILIRRRMKLLCSMFTNAAILWY